MKTLTHFLPAHPLLLRLALLWLALAGPLLAADDPLAGDLKKLQGKWRATVKSERGDSVWKMEIKENHATVVIETEDGDTVFKAETDLKLEKAGAFRAFTIFNLKILSGNGAGETRYTNGETKSSIYKLADDTLTTVGGVRDDDTDKPQLFKWSRP